MGTPLQGAASHPPVVERAALAHLALQGALGRDQGCISVPGQAYSVSVAPRDVGLPGQCKALLLGWIPFPRMSRKSPLTSLAPDKAGQ